MSNLKKYLTINSLFSGLTGIIMALFYSQLNNFFHIDNNYIFPIIGINLIVFSVFVGYVSQKQLTNKLLVNLIVILDLFWVVGSLIILALDLFDLSKNGYLVIGAIALWIAFLGYKQNRYNK